MDSKSVAQAGIAIGGVFALGWAGSAAAADVGTFSKQAVAPAGAAKFDPWNAFSIGFGVVGQTTSTPTTYYDTILDEDVSRLLTGSGIGGTIEIGKDFHPAGSPIVFGLYGDLKIGSQTATLGTSSTKYGYNTNFEHSVTFSNSGTIAARLGVAASNNLLLYGLAGYTWQQYAAQESTSGTYGQDTATRSGMLSGLTLGLGAELALTGDVTLKGEYRYTQLGSIPYYESGDAKASHGKTNLQQIRVVLSKKWN